MKTKAFTPQWMTNGRSNRFIRVYINMMESDAFNSLTKNQRLLLIYMYAEYNPSTKTHHPKNNINFFYFNRKKYKSELALYSNDRQFYMDRDALVRHGFIEVVEAGYLTRSKSIYKYSQNWKRYDPKRPFIISGSGRTGSMSGWGRH